jgi:hypothetical protein
MPSTIMRAALETIADSPRPSTLRPPTSLSTNRPAPMIGESPTRPGSFHASRAVEVRRHRDRRRAERVQQFTVPWFWIMSFHVGIQRRARIRQPVVVRRERRLPVEPALAATSR